MRARSAHVGHGAAPGPPSGHAGAAPAYRLPLALLLSGLLLSVLLARAPWLAMGTMVGGGLIVLILLRPIWVLTALLFIGPIDLAFLTGGEKTLFENVGGLDMNGIRLMAVVGGFGLLALIDRGIGRAATGRYGRWYLVFVAWAILTLAYSWVPLDGVRLLLKLLYPFLLFVVVLGGIRERRQLDRLGDAIFIGAALITILLNPLYMLGGGFVHDQVLGVRVGGVGIYAAAWSFYLLIMLIASLVRFSTRGQLRYLALAAVCVFWIVLALSRTALLAGMAALALLALHSAVVRRDYRLMGAVVGIGVVLGAILLPAFLQKTFGHVVPTPGELLALARDPVSLFERVRLSGREIFWPIIFLYFLGSPIIGLGLGTTTFIMETRLPAEAGGVVHNEYLRLATETGLIGLALFAVAVIAWARGVARASLRPEPWVSEWSLAAIGALAVWAVTAVADNSIDYYAPVSQFVAVLAAGAIWAARHASRNDRPEVTQ
ncbi:MAG: O-antigen ligase family protein [Gemmatimonadota bacterium]